MLSVIFHSTVECHDHQAITLDIWKLLQQKFSLTYHIPTKMSLLQQIIDEKPVQLKKKYTANSSSGFKPAMTFLIVARFCKNRSNIYPYAVNILMLSLPEVISKGNMYGAMSL